MREVLLDLTGDGRVNVADAACSIQGAGISVVQRVWTSTKQCCSKAMAATGSTSYLHIRRGTGSCPCL